MKKLRFIQAGWVLLLAVLVLSVSVINPALATTNTARHSSANQQLAASTSINASIYVTLATMAPRFQDGISRRVPQSFNSAINALISKLPAQDQGWALEMATTLIQPSATLQNLVTQPDGLAATISISLYPGDPKPTIATMLFSFSVLDSSTIQVSANPINGGPALASGPVDTLQMPLGRVNSVNTTPNCGQAALDFNLQIPVSLGQASTQSQLQLANAVAHGNPMATMLPAINYDATNTFIEIPASSLASIGSSIGSLPVSSSFTAQNIRVSVQGKNLHVQSDIYWSGLNIGTADSTIAPSASGGKLVLTVTNTSLSVFGLFSIPINSYNAQIQQTLNSKLGNAFAGKFSVSQAGIGSTSQLPCAKGDSLVMSGTSALG
jgi:hypothetical protein